MTESEWLASEDPGAMLAFLTQVSFGPAGLAREDEERRQQRRLRPSDRKLRLFACAVARQTWHRLSERYRKAVEVAERHADGDTEPNERGKAFNATDNDPSPTQGYPSPTQGYLAMACLRADALEGAREIVSLVEEWVPRSTQVALLRDIVGNPFRSWCVAEKKYEQTLKGYQVFDLDWLTPQVLSLAQAAYSERAGRECEKCKGNRFIHGVAYNGLPYTEKCDTCNGTGRIDDGTLDPFRLALVADALEEAGCETTPCRYGNGYDHSSCEGCDKRGNAIHPILAHLRSPGPHYRGMWPLDVILGKA